MAKRGRKSTAELSVVPPATPARPGLAPPSPPAHLCAAAAEAWRSITGSRPHDFFDRGSLPLLETLVVATAEHRRLSALLAKLDPSRDFAKYAALTRACDTHALRIGSAATKLRLSQQSRYEPRTAATAARNSRPSSIAILENYRNAG